MNNVVILPVIIPVIAGLMMVLFRKKIRLHRLLSVLALFALLLVSIFLILQIETVGIQVLQAGGWPAPYGISFVADMFAALLLLSASIVALFCLLYSFRSIGREREEHYFYPLFLFLIAGVNGSFLTGDLFHLFVCFEVMLISSYVLISLGGTGRQLRESLKYILVNVVSSSLFLVAVAYLYALTGTLNFAHLSVVVAKVGQEGLMTTVALLFLLVFSIKSALFLFFWLPESYSAPPTAIAAIFAALLTKVGLYTIFRMFTLIFYHEPQITHQFIGVLGAATMVLGAFGAVAFSDIKKILTYNVIVGAGFVIAGLAAFTADGVMGSVFYLLHDILVKGLIFLIGGAIIRLTGTSNLNEVSGLIRYHPYLGWMFFISALSLAGIPPLSGFVGKIFITKGTFQAEYFWLGAVGLLTSLMVLYSLMKVFMNVFWGETTLSKEKEKGTTKGLVLPISGLTALSVMLGLGAEVILPYVRIAAETLLVPSQYIKAVLGLGE
ncbi:Na+/H+ antiporter subunit D [Neobacillus kokaensis]|uniref:Na+/H+ antiporter subunit D n=1 Tax=Neobacillus kokaensis TaxID=2759023 RepID=A0ABQ3N778_9BACI|nr:Na+/H+ antiporter subunit D [Neobacillus kokaensis]GHI00794.1 Na+/H+ antiporter subunit D [Neobacillus kokaensis]